MLNIRSFSTTKIDPSQFEWANCREGSTFEWMTEIPHADDTLEAIERIA